jgi:integrase
MLIDNGPRLCFEVPHKNDFRPNAPPRRLVFGDEMSQTLRVLMDIAGDDAIFSPLMFELVDRFKVPLDQPDELKRQYEEFVRKAKESGGDAARGLARKLQPIPAGNFRQRLQKHAQIVPYDVRHMSISEIARTDDRLAQKAAGHKDPKATSGYIHRGLEDHKRLAADTEPILRKSLGGAGVAP